jgi:hypothetical protein
MIPFKDENMCASERVFGHVEIMNDIIHENFEEDNWRRKIARDDEKE